MSAHRLNFAEPVADDAVMSRVPMSRPVYGTVYREVPLTVGQPTPWTDPFYGWQLWLIGKENDGRTLVLEARRPAGLS